MLLINFYIVPIFAILENGATAHSQASPVLQHQVQPKKDVSSVYNIWIDQYRIFRIHDYVSSHERFVMIMPYSSCPMINIKTSVPVNIY